MSRITNRDWIESLSDEQLASLIVYREGIPGHVFYGGTSTYASVLDWLSKEREEDQGA